MIGKLDLRSIYEWPLSLQSLVILPLCGLIFYLAYFLDYISLNRQLESAKHQEVDLKQQLDMVVSQQIKLENELTQLVTLKQMIAEWQKKFVVPAKLPDLLNDILKIGTGNGLVINKMSPGVEVKEDIYTKIPIKIDAQGGYNQISGFISHVANMSSLVVVRSLILTKPKIDESKKLIEQATQKNSLTIEMVLDVYYLLGDT